MSYTTTRPRIEKTDAEWREQLTPEQYSVARKHGTERAGSSPLNQEKRDGTFHCVCCDAPLFKSDTKFESGTGWPSFYQAQDADAVDEHDDHVLRAFEGHQFFHERLLNAGERNVYTVKRLLFDRAVDADDDDDNVSGLFFFIVNAAKLDTPYFSF